MLTVAATNGGAAALVTTRTFWTRYVVYFLTVNIYSTLYYEINLQKLISTILFSAALTEGFWNSGITWFLDYRPASVNLALCGSEPVRTSTAH